MAVSKRTRFEVLRRDSHTCRYCGAKAPEVKITLDHVVPIALGGTDDPSNLVAACAPCNSGKSSSTPDAAVVAQIDEDALRWALARQRALARMQGEKDARRDRVQPFLDVWAKWHEMGYHLPLDWENTIDLWLAQGIPMERILEAARIAVAAHWVKPASTFRYMAGVVNNWLREIDAATTAELAAMKAEEN